MKEDQLTSVVNRFSSPVERPFRRSTLLGVAVLAAAAGCVALLFAFDPATNGFYPRCTFHAWTGLDCPGCGGLRAAHQLLHGHVRAAFAFNPLLTSAVPLAVLAGIAQFIPALRELRAKVLRNPLALWMGAGVIVVFGVLRNLPWRLWIG